MVPAVPPGGLTEAYWAADRSVPLVDYTVGSLLAARAAEHPDREALVGVRHGSADTVRLTYRELYDEAVRVATALSRLVEPGSSVALWAPNVVEWTIIQYGAALAGAVLVALNPVLRADDLDYALRHCGTKLLLHADVSRDYSMAEVAAHVCSAIPDLRRVSLSETTVWKSPEGDSGTFVGGRSNPDSVVMLQYTSGTTGRSKGVALTHRALVNVAKLTMEGVEAPTGAVCANPLPLFHTAGCVIATLGPLWIGGTLVLWERFLPGPALEALRAENVDIMFYVPAVLDALLEQQRVNHTPPPRLRVIMGGASDVPPALIDGAAEIFGAGVFNLYGQTELAPVLSMTRPGDEPQDLVLTVGQPLPQVDCKVIDPHDGHVLAIGETGEICARGYQQFVEYLHDPDATERALDDDGFVRTGDLGTMDARGYLSLSGRLKELIIRGGENIAPAEVENVVAQHDSVLDAVAIGLPDKRLGEVVAVVCRVSSTDHAGLRASLADHCRKEMASYKVPAHWFVTDQFPVTPTGKIRRHMLRDSILQGELSEL